MNIWDYAVLALVAAVLIAAVVKVVRDRRKGKSSCCGNCAACSCRSLCENRTSIPDPPEQEDADDPLP